MKWKCLCVVIISLFSSLILANESASSDACIKIRHIQIEASDVYGKEEEPDFFESIVNFFHFKTRDSVIKEELLFQEGDCLDKELTAETARNLRSLPIFSEVFVTVSPVDGTNEADVLVATQDRFTLRAEVSASHNAGTTKTRMSFGEKNLFGYNKAFHFSQTEEDDDKKTRYVYKDGRFLHDYVLDVSYTSAFDGGLESYSLADPFRSLDDKSAYSISYNKNTQNFIYKLDGNEEEEVPQFYERIGLGYSHEFGSRKKSKRIGFSLSNTKQNYFREDTSIETNIPDQLERVDLDIKASLTNRYKFTVIQGLDSLVYREDIKLFNSFVFGLGVQQRDDSAGIGYHPKYQVGFREVRYNQDNLLSSYYFNHSGRYYAGDLLETETTAFYHCYYLPEPGHVWVGGLTYQYRYGKDILNKPLSMGGGVGLRGYEMSSFTGNKSLLMNLEFRHRLPSKWSKVAIGQAFFADTGFAWKKGEAMSVEDLKANVGWGLRLDIPSIFGEDVLRFDLAVATDTGDVLASVTLGQVFNHDELTENNQEDF